MKHINRFHVLLLIVFIIGLILRIYNVGSIPSGITNDEVTYSYNAYSLFKTGKDLTGNFLPWITKIAVPFMPVPIYSNALFIGILGPSLFSARLFNVILGSLTIFLLYLLILKLFKSNKIALSSTFILSVSPWHLQLSRSAYDPVIALVLYLLAIYLFLFSIEQKKIISKVFLYLSSFISFFLALFSYRAMNIIFIPVIASLIWFGFTYYKKHVKEGFMFLLGIILILSAVILINQKQGAYYTNELFNSKESPVNFNLAQTVVNSTIAHADAPLLISRIFENKITYFLRIFRENYLNAFSTNFLFTQGEAQPVYSLWLRGMMYLIDFPLILAGFYYLYKKNKRSFQFVLLSLLIAPLPSALGGPTYAARSFYMLPFLATLAGGGMCLLWDYLSRFHLIKRTIFVLIFITLYFIQITSYLYQYHARYSIYGAEAWFKSTLDLSKYIDNHKQQNVLLADASVFEFINYAFYTKMDPVIAQAVFNKGYKINRYEINNVKMFYDCIGKGDDNPKDILPLNTIYIVRNGCHTDFPADEFIRKYDGKFTETSEKIWKIYKSKDLTTNL